MWPFNNRQHVGIKANSVVIDNGIAIIDVRGQTCPGYLLAINKAVESLATGTSARLLITYPPCGEDVKAWAKQQKIEYQGIEQQNEIWVIRIRK